MPPFNGSGTFNRSDGTRSGTQVWQDADAAGIKIRADDHDTHDQDIADGLENTVTLDGQNTTTTDNAILRYDSGNTQFEGVSISASQIVGRSATGDTRGMSAATARQTIGLGTAVSTNNTILQYSSASNQYVEFKGFGTASPSNNTSLFFVSASSTYEQKTAASARSILGVPDFATSVGINNEAIFWASANSQYESKSAATARSLLGLGTAAPKNNQMLVFASASSSYEQEGKGSLVPLAQASASNDATVDFTNNIDSTYNLYAVYLFGIVPATDNVVLRLRTSTDGGSTWDSGASDYVYRADERRSDTDNADIARSTGSSFIRIVGSLGTAAGESLSGWIYLWQPSAASKTSLVTWNMTWEDQVGVHRKTDGGARRDAAEDVDAIRFLMSSGNISSGAFQLYGVKTS